VVLFGENVPATRVQSAVDALHRSDALLILGTSVQVFSAFRFVKAAAAAGIPIGVVNAGPIRGEEHAELVVRGLVGEVLPKLVEGLGPPQGQRAPRRRQAA